MEAILNYGDAEGVKGLFEVYGVKKISEIFYRQIKKERSNYLPQVKLTFFQFPHKIETPLNLDGFIRMPDLLTLSAIKAYALGGRGKWKDYVDLFFIFKHHFSFEQVTQHAKTLFIDAFNEKLFRQQLCYFEDISFEEEVEYFSSRVPEEEIKDFLKEVSLTAF